MKTKFLAGLIAAIVAVWLLWTSFVAWGQGPEIFRPRGGGGGVANVITTNSNAGITNLILSLDLWTNDVVDYFGVDQRVLRPVDQTRAVAETQVSTNQWGWALKFLDTNNAHTLNAAAVFQNSSTNGGDNAGTLLKGVFGVGGELVGDSGALITSGKEGVGAYGYVNTSLGIQYGIMGVALAQYNNQSNVAVIGRGIIANTTGSKTVGGYFDVNATGIGGVGQITHGSSAVIRGDSRDSSVTLLDLMTNGNTTVFSVTAAGDPKIPGGAGLGKMMRDADGAGTGRWQSYPSSASDTNTLQAIVTNVVDQYARIGPGTPGFLAQFITPTNVTDSRIQQVATNMWHWNVRTNPALTINYGATNRFFAHSNSATDWEALDIISQPEAAAYHEIKAVKGAGDAGLAPLLLNDVLVIEPSANPDGGHTAKFIYAKGWHKQADLGSSSVAFKSLWVAGDANNTTGIFLVERNTTCTVKNFGHSGGYGFGLSTVDMSLFDAGGNKFCMIGNTGTAQQGIDLGVRQLQGGDADSLFFQRSSFLMFHDADTEGGILQMSTNSLGTAVQSPRIQGARAAGTDKPGGGAYLSTGESTGANNTSGGVGFKTTMQQSTGSSQNTMQIREYVSPNLVALTDNTATTFCTVSNITSGKFVRVTVETTVNCNDASNYQVVGDTVSVSVANPSGTIGTPIYSTSTPQSIFTSSGTITTAITAAANNNGIDIKMTADTSLTATTFKCRWRLRIDSDAIVHVWDSGVKHL